MFTNPDLAEAAARVASAGTAVVLHNRPVDYGRRNRDVRNFDYLIDELRFEIGG